MVTSLIIYVILSDVKLQYLTSHDCVIFAISHGRPLTHSAFHNDECHVMAFRPISEAAHSWSYDNQFLQARCSSWCPTTSVKSLKAIHCTIQIKANHIYCWNVTTCSISTKVLQSLTWVQGNNFFAFTDSPTLMNTITNNITIRTTTTTTTTTTTV